jgi:hypothetical protein
MNSYWLRFQMKKTGNVVAYQSGNIVVPIPSQNPIENVNSKVPDLESKQRFSEDSEWSTLGALKMP